MSKFENRTDKKGKTRPFYLNLLSICETNRGKNVLFNSVCKNLGSTIHLNSS